jgi:hypothetical protein
MATFYGAEEIGFREPGRNAITFSCHAPVVAGHGPYVLSGLQPSAHMKLVATKRLKSGIVALHYRRR